MGGCLNINLFVFWWNILLIYFISYFATLNIIPLCDYANTELIRPAGAEIYVVTRARSVPEELAQSACWIFGR